MYLKSLELNGFKSFAKRSDFQFATPVTAVVGPNGSGKSNVAEAISFVLGEQSMKSLRGKRGEDLIWNGGRTLPRVGRASVKIVLDNKSRLLPVDFEEVTIERVVHRDGVSDYYLNGSTVRLRDVVELLSGAGIGPSGHHIISQGEADKMLSTTSAERREILEEAMGLKIYQYKKRESEKKLEKTEENVKQVESLRREIAPHLRFLGRQMEKVSRARTLRAELAAAYRQYFKREEIYLTGRRREVGAELSGPAAELASLKKELAKAKAALETSENFVKGREKVSELEEKLRRAREEKDAISRSLGRVEGELSAEEKVQAEGSEPEGRKVPLSKLEGFAEAVAERVLEAERQTDLNALKSALAAVRRFISSFLSAERETAAGQRSRDDERKKLYALKDSLAEKFRLAAEAEDGLGRQIALEREKLEREKEGGRRAEREIWRIQAAESQTAMRLSAAEAAREKLSLEEAEFKRELGEAAAICGREALNFAGTQIEARVEEREEQLLRRRRLEKMKLRLEEAGGGGAEVEGEYREAKERDAYLERELSDLEKSAGSLRELIRSLGEKLRQEFEAGLQRINVEFQKFFALMFGGGTAALVLEKPGKRVRIELEEVLLASAPPEAEKEKEAGIEIEIFLPHKKIRTLEALSGGERALTSIALIFAVSQVKPPPFLVLDETDAALDEANSRRYGDMVENLAAVSQLILITHNRETMSRAGALYGVTMGSEGFSRVLSVKLDEAVKVAK
ncbi:MAG: AAA family ATPase [Candidatus Taylorbacteria bacterium]|nr:AAA family ATPase [Candidatus Taylorbacteria bacterium]